MLAFGVILGTSIHSNGPRCNKLAMKLMKVKVLIEVLIGLLEQRRSFFLHFFVCFVPRFSPTIFQNAHQQKAQQILTFEPSPTPALEVHVCHICHFQTPFTLQTQIQPQATLRLDVFGGNDDGTGAKTPISASFPLTNYSRRSTCAVPRPGIPMADGGGKLGGWDVLGHEGVIF